MGFEASIEGLLVPRLLVEDEESDRVEEGREEEADESELEGESISRIVFALSVKVLLFLPLLECLDMDLCCRPPRPPPPPPPPLNHLLILALLLEALLVEKAEAEEEDEDEDEAD